MSTRVAGSRSFFAYVVTFILSNFKLAVLDACSFTSMTTGRATSHQINQSLTAGQRFVECIATRQVEDISIKLNLRLVSGGTDGSVGAAYFALHDGKHASLSSLGM
jgi:hypothetical protein